MKTKKSVWKGFGNLLMPLLFLLTLISVDTNAQQCTNPPNALVNGNFDLPTTAIATNSVPAINNNMPGWFVSHGTPTTQALPNRSMWMWSYSSKGEGVFNCYNFVAGETYLICFDLQTNGKADGATAEVRATSGLNASTGSTTYPTVANELIWSDLIANYSYNNWSQISVLYTPTSSYSQIWFHPFMAAHPPGTPAPQGNPSQSEMRIDNVSISQVTPGGGCPCDLTAAFSYSSDTCSVQFTDASSGNCCTDILGWYWNFGDGSTATGQNPQHTYAASGTYNACLVIVGYNGDGECCTDSVCMPVTVNCDTCVCEVNADFEYDANNCDVQFEDISTHSECTTITNWQWDFGDGNGSTAQNPAHTYAASGTYTVCLSVTGTLADGTTCEDDTCYDITVECDDPCICDVQADFRYSINGCFVQFDDISILSPCSQSFQWEWDFGDGNMSNLQNPSHTYAASGSYTVCFTVWATDGQTICKSTICYKIVVNCDGDADAAQFKNSYQDLPLELNIFPNPTSGDVFIEFSNPKNLAVNVTVLNSAGTTIAELLNEKDVQNEYSLKWSPANDGFASGIYYIRITTGDIIKYEKVIFEK